MAGKGGCGCREACTPLRWRSIAAGVAFAEAGFEEVRRAPDTELTPSIPRGISGCYLNFRWSTTWMGGRKKMKWSILSRGGGGEKGGTHSERKLALSPARHLDFLAAETMKHDVQ